MSWANNNSNTKKYYNGGNVPYSAGAYTGLDLTNLIQGRDFKTQVEEQLLGEQTKEVKTGFQQRKQEELEAEAAEASKKSQKYGVLGSATGTLLSLIPGWGKFAKMGTDALTAGAQSDIFKDLAKKGKMLKGTFLESLGEDFTAGYEKMASGFDPLEAGIKSIAGSYISEGISDVISEKGVETLDEAVKGAEIAEDAGYTVEDLQRVGDYTAKDWAMDETIDLEALEAYEKLAADFKPGKITDVEKTYGDMNFQERIQTLLPEFAKGETTDNFSEIMKMYQKHGPILGQLLAEPEEGESVEQLFRGYGY
tara:strand:+ start:2137 stop:3063 length:927 start_codon:yes stop_codon:yes gene_type:complete